jgi:single-strand DNA-binding protein
MAGLNKVMLIGNLGKDPEVKDTGNGVKLAIFPLATSEDYKDRDGNRQTRTEWHNIVLWRALADLAVRFLTKGQQVYIEGRLSTRKWEDKDGNTRYTTEIVGDNLVLLGRKPGENGGPANPGNQSGAGSITDDYSSTDSQTDDLPF